MTPLPLIGQEPELTKESPGDLKLWSVTTLIDVVGKKALEYWAALKTAECAVDEQAVWGPMLEHKGRDVAVDYIKGARYRAPKGQRSATALGTAVHHALERKVLDGQYAEADRMDLELRPYLHQINRFLKDFAPKFQASEVTVFSPRYGYAGTCDGFMEIEGQRFIYDLKTTKERYDAKGDEKGPYPEVSLQLAAYRHAQHAAVWRARQAKVLKRRYYLLNETELALAVPVPEVDHGVVLHVTPESYGLYPVSCGPDVFEVFLAVVDVARWAYQQADEMVGNALIPPNALRDSTDPFAGIS